MRVRIERFGKFGNRCYVDVYMPGGGWLPWNDEPINRRQARRLAEALRRNEPQEG